MAPVDVRAIPGGSSVTVRVRPRSRPALEIDGDILVVRVAAPPIDGRATEEARRRLATAVGLPPGAVSLRGGARSRTKTFALAGVDPDEARRRLTGAAARGS